MKYIIYKLSFQTGVHFGNGILNDTKYTFCADTLFSALCIEAIRQGKDCLEQLYSQAKQGNILFSDGFPYIQDTFYLPKPILSIEYDAKNPSNHKKWKKLSYIPFEQMDVYLSGKMDVDIATERLGHFGKSELRQMVNLQDAEKSEPYAVGIYHYYENNGLYFILGYQDESERNLIKNLLLSLSYQGFGGKVSAGLGHFSVLECDMPEAIIKRLSAQAERFMLLSTSLPRQDEMEAVLESANYLLEKRSGFVQSCSYAEEFVKKSEMYFLKSGSVVRRRYDGDIYEVGTKGNHAVWRYGKPILMEV